jgi:hypothetical protein
MPKLDIATRNIVIGRHQVNELQNAVARFYNVHRSAISRLLQRYQQSGSTADRERSGRPRITWAAQYRYIRIKVNSSTSCVRPSVVVSKIPLRRFIAGRICGDKTSSLYRSALRLPGMCTSWIFRAYDVAPHIITFSAEIVDLKDAVPCKTPCLSSFPGEVPGCSDIGLLMWS